MNASIYSNVSWIVFLFLAGVQLTRIVLGWSVSVNGWAVPFWASAGVLLVTGYLAYMGYRLSFRRR